MSSWISGEPETQAERDRADAWQREWDVIMAWDLVWCVYTTDPRSLAEGQHGYLGAGWKLGGVSAGTVYFGGLGYPVDCVQQHPDLDDARVVIVRNAHHYNARRRS